MRRFLFFCVALIAFFAANFIGQLGRYRDVYRSICDLTEDHFYKDNQAVRDWVAKCQSRAAHVPLRMTSDKLLESIQDQMSELNVSHFSVYSPVEDRKLWKGESTDTGIRSRYVEDHLLIYQIFPGSSAEKVGMHLGDEIVALPGADQVTPYGAEHRSGVFKIRRAGKPLDFEVKPSPLTIDSSPTLRDLGGGVGLLTISSFRSEFFDAQPWRDLARGFGRFKHIIVDIRENAGGNFVAMLRALSVFDCGGRVIGHLVQPRKAGPLKSAFDDVTEDAYQLKELDRYHSMGLRTFDGYGCYRGKVTVLVSSDTASVAEIFADSFLHRPGARVWGQPSAGDVVLAVWYDLPLLGPGFSVSIPEAVYLNLDKKELEGVGVSPQKELYYDLKLSMQGKDSWLIEALR